MVSFCCHSHPVIVIVITIIIVIMIIIRISPRDLYKGHKEIGIETKIVELQKTVILKSARILRKVLEF